MHIEDEKSDSDGEYAIRESLDAGCFRGHGGLAEVSLHAIKPRNLTSQTGLIGWVATQADLCDFELNRDVSAVYVLLSFPVHITVVAQSVLKAFLRVVAWLLFVVAGLSFWVGGRAISEFGKVDRMLAEFFGLLVAGVAGLFGYILKEKADDFDDSRDSLRE
jgi:hypothetical protein